MPPPQKPTHACHNDTQMMMANSVRQQQKQQQQPEKRLVLGNFFGYYCLFCLLLLLLHIYFLARCKNTVWYDRMTAKRNKLIYDTAVVGRLASRLSLIKLSPASAVWFRVAGTEPSHKLKQFSPWPEWKWTAQFSPVCFSSGYDQLGECRKQAQIKFISLIPFLHKPFYFGPYIGPAVHAFYALCVFITFFFSVLLLR